MKHVRTAPSPPYLLVEGEPRKGLHYALRAWIESGIADKGRLLICGTIMPNYRNALTPLLRHPSIHEQGFVERIGAVMRLPTY